MKEQTAKCPKCKIGNIRINSQLKDDHVNVIIYKCDNTECGHQPKTIEELF